jgi:2-methylaconitate cis-trans-isomerase PrpF
MGGGTSSLSKAVIIGPSTHPDADVDYTFIQIAIDKPIVDWTGNCGNLSSVIGPYAVDMGLVKVPDGEVTVRFHQTNTKKIIHARFFVENGMAAIDGDMEIAGVAGKAAPVRLDFVKPGGAATGKLLPTGQVVDQLPLPNGQLIDVSLVDASHPNAFLRARDLGLTGTEAPDDLQANSELMATLEHLRRKAGVKMGLAASEDKVTLTGPRIGVVAEPQTYVALDKATISDDYEISTRMISVEQPHRAVPLSSGLCLAVACRIEGTLPHQMSRKIADGQPIRIGNPSGLLTYGADVRQENGQWVADSAGVYRTSRCLMKGMVAVPRHLVG